MFKKKVLIIEDEPTIRKGIGEMFSDECIVEYAIDGSEGLFKILNNKYDLIITDNHMPHLSGVRMLEMHREKKKFKTDTPIIMCTTECDPITKKRGLKAGVNYWMIKPLNILGFFKLAQKILDEQEVQADQV